MNKTRITTVHRSSFRFHPSFCSRMGSAGSPIRSNSPVSAHTSRCTPCRFLRADRYKTPTKVRILGGFPHASRQQIVRYDIEDAFQITKEEADRFAWPLRDQMTIAQAGLISDYGYGVVTPALAGNLTGFSR